MGAEREYRYRVVDVFTERVLEGNALAVFPDASGLDGALMQRIARELNLPETTFVLSPTRADCTARVRIFTPLKEMRFAGHPTLGTAFVLRDEGYVPVKTGDFVLEEEVGTVPVRVDASEQPMFWLRTPPIETGRHYDAALCATVLGLDRSDLLDCAPQRLSAGNPTIFVPLRNRDAVDRAWIDLAGMKTLRGADAEPVCVFVFTPMADGAYSRMFAPEYGIAEDPATGSSTGPLAVYMMRHGLVASIDGTRFVSEQGVKMGRRSSLYVQVHGDNGAIGIEVGGHVTPVASATMRLTL